jgi:hypothetical protein
LHNGLLQGFALVAGNSLLSLSALQSLHKIILNELQGNGLLDQGVESSTKVPLSDRPTESLFYADCEQVEMMQRVPKSFFGHVFMLEEHLTFRDLPIEKIHNYHDSALLTSTFLKESIVHLQLICSRCSIAVRDAAKWPLSGG